MLSGVFATRVCERHLKWANWTALNFKRIIFYDEFKINLFGYDGKADVRIALEELFGEEAVEWFENIFQITVLNHRH